MCSLSSLTRNMALGSSSITVPLNSIMSSFDIRPHANDLISRRNMSAGQGKVKQCRIMSGRFWLQRAARCCGHAHAALPPRRARSRPGRSRPSAGGIRRDPGGALEEVEHRQARGEPRGAAGRQHMVRAGHVVAHRLGAEARRGTPRRHGGCAANTASGSRSMSCRCSGAKPVHQRRRLVPVAHQDDGAVRLPARRRRWRRGAGSAAPLPPPRATASANAASSVIRMACAASSCSAWASRSTAMWRGSLSPLGEDDDLGRAGDGVDADPAEHLPLGLGDIGVAGADDAIDGRDGRRCRRPAPRSPGRRRRDRSRPPRRAARRPAPAG